MRELESYRQGSSDVFCYLPRCPDCGESDYQTQRSERHGDGAKTQWAKCRQCGFNFKICWE